MDWTDKKISVNYKRINKLGSVIEKDDQNFEFVKPNMRDLIFTKREYNQVSYWDNILCEPNLLAGRFSFRFFSDSHRPTEPVAIVWHTESVLPSFKQLMSICISDPIHLQRWCQEMMKSYTFFSYPRIITRLIHQQFENKDSDLWTCRFIGQNKIYRLHYLL